MKRKREEEEVAESEIRCAIHELSVMTVNLKTAAVAADDVPNPKSVHHVPIKPFLSLCNLVIQVLGTLDNFVTVDLTI